MRMNRIQASFLGLVLCFIALRISSAETEKPGKCPPERFYRSNGFTSSLCKNDSECSGNQKCCSDNGFKICKPPAEERKGSCPTKQPGTTTSNRCDDTCTSDSECAKGAKCCYRDCGLACGPSIGVKKGFCDSEEVIMCFRAERSFCNDDTGCPDDEKCCQYTCATKCKKPLKERIGTCPPVGYKDSDSQVTSVKKTEKCDTDYQCKSPKKCCSTTSGKSCVAPLQHIP